MFRERNIFAITTTHADRGEIPGDMDEFAQTRSPDDLFDDDFTPITESPSKQLGAPPPSTDSPRTSYTPRAPFKNARRSSSHNSTIQDSTSSSNPQDLSNDAEPTQKPTSPDATTDTNNTTTPRAPKTHQAVRGNRLATGGTPRTKLTEQELTERLEAAKINNAKRAEAYRLAEADEADFQLREAQVTQKRLEESKARRIMDLEREKNRLRKLEAGIKGNREWDEGKEERDEERSRGYRRGVNGGIGGRGGRGGRGGTLFEGYQDQLGERQGGFEFRGRGRGRGERGGGRGGGRGGRGRGRGIEFPSKTWNAADQKVPDPKDDFPALPTTKQPAEQTLPPDKIADSLKTVDGKGESWADHVEPKDFS